MYRKVRPSSHILAGPSDGGKLPLHMINHHGSAYLKRRFALVHISQFGFNGLSLISRPALLPHGFTLDVVLYCASMFLLVRCHLHWESYWCSGPLWHR
jgi:hypothetical protein